MYWICLQIDTGIDTMVEAGDKIGFMHETDESSLASDFVDQIVREQYRISKKAIEAVYANYIYN